jgi:transposase
MTIVEAPPGITGGVDTHLDAHVAAALDPLGRLIGTESFPADAAGYKALLAWLEGFGQVTKVGIEGTSSYGTGLARSLRRRGIEIVEVNRPNRQSRRNQGKSDPLDAIEAARAAISGRATGAGKSKDGPIEAIRVLVVAKRSARHLAAESPGRGSDSPLICRPSGLTFQQIVDPRSGPYFDQTRDFVRACPRPTSDSSLICPLS